MPSSRQRTRKDGPAPEGPYDALLCFNFYVGWRAIQEFYGPAFPPELNPQRLYVLGLCKAPGASVSQIATSLHIDDAAVSNMLGRLERDGLVERRPAPDDARGVISVITAKGRRMAEATDARLKALDRQLADRITDTDVAAVERVVRSLLNTGCTHPSAQ
jgi:DNA-binding MarR family transcriptional regulator